MDIKKCDICKKKIEYKAMIRVGVSRYGDKDFCLKCGKPIFDFLEEHKLLKEEK